MKLPAQFRPIVFAVAMAGMMSIAMSFALTAINVGLTENFVSLWLRACLVAFVVAVPISLFAGPVANRIADTFTQVQEEHAA